jgi:RNA-directed DNA polymerase
MKLWKKSENWVIKSSMKDKAVKRATKKLQEKVKLLQKNPTINSVNEFNATVLGLHNYYSMATNVYLDFDKIAFHVNKSLKCRLKNILSKNIIKSKAYQKFYGDYTGQLFAIKDRVLFPIVSVKNKPPKNYSQDICKYTITGRAKIYACLHFIDMQMLKQIMENPVGDKSAEYNDNRISLYVGQQGKCYISKALLEADKMEVHHIKPLVNGGTDEYKNLVWVTTDIHRLIHASTAETIEKYMGKLDGAEIDVEILNKLRNSVGNCEISLNK